MPSIDSTLSRTRNLRPPEQLVANTQIAFKGTGLGGKWFVLTAEDVSRLPPIHQEIGIVKPYIIGQELASISAIVPKQFCIDFGERTLEEAQEYREVLALLSERVRKYATDPHKVFSSERGWKHRRSARALYTRITDVGCETVIGKIQTTNTWAFVSLPTGWVFDQSVIILVFDRRSLYGALQSTLHEVWAWRYGSTLKTDLRYSPTEIFLNFPLPVTDTLYVGIAEQYRQLRHQLMLMNQEGLTTTYNRFHGAGETDENIILLRDLHVELDQAVAAGYGWHDLDLEHGFHETQRGLRFTISERARREVLARLLALNHERYAEEVRQGLHEEKGKKGATGKRAAKAKKSDDRQISMF